MDDSGNKKTKSIADFFLMGFSQSLPVYKAQPPNLGGFPKKKRGFCLCRF